MSITVISKTPLLASRRGGSEAGVAPRRRCLPTADRLQNSGDRQFVGRAISLVGVGCEPLSFVEVYKEGPSSQAEASKYLWDFFE